MAILGLIFLFLLPGCMGGEAMVAPYLLGGVVGPAVGGYAAGKAMGGNAPSTFTATELRTDSVLAHAEDAVMRVTVHSLIEPNGTGSWFKDSPWQEAVFTVENKGSGDISMAEVRMVDEHGVVIDQLTDQALYEVAEQFSNRARQDYMNDNSLGKTMATYGGGMLADMFIPGAGLASSAWYMSSGESKEKKMIQQQNDIRRAMEEFRKRQVLRAELAAHGILTGSAFFPLRKAREFRVGYHTGRSAEREIVIIFPPH